MTFRLLMLMTLIAATVGCQKSAADVPPRDREIPLEVQKIKRLGVDRFSSDIAIQKNAEQWFSKNEMPAIVMLTDLMQQGNPTARGEAANQIALMISPGLRSLRFQQYFYHRPFRHDLPLPLSRADISQHADLVRTSAIKSLDEAYSIISNTNGENNPLYLDWIYSLSSLCECLSEVGDISTADHLIELLKQQNTISTMAPLISCIEKIHGLPPSYQHTGICGNSTEAEFESFRVRELSKINHAANQLVFWHERTRTLSPEQRLELTLNKWMTKLETPPYYDYYYATEYDLIWPRCASLIRLGKDAVPHLQIYQTETDDFKLKAKLALAITAITGEEDNQMIAQLIAGESTDQAMACEMIAITRSKNWNTELDTMQTTLSSPSSKASMTLIVVLGKQALPFLKRTKSEEFVVQNAILELEKWDDPDD